MESRASVTEEHVFRRLPDDFVHEPAEVPTLLVIVATFAGRGPIDGPLTVSGGPHCRGAGSRSPGDLCATSNVAL